MSEKNNQKVRKRVYTPDLPSDIFHNQSLFHQNFLQTTMNKQLLMNEDINQSISLLQSHMQNTDMEQFQKLDTISQNMHKQDVVLNELIKQHSTHQNQTKEMIEKMTTLENASTENKKWFDQESDIHHAILDQLAFQDTAISTLNNKMTELKILSEELINHLEKAETFQKNVNEKLDMQEIIQQTITDQISETDASLNKVMMQLDVLKAIIFERIHYLSEKIEANFVKITKPVQKFFVQLDDKEKSKK